jgi:Glycosyl hydrolase family 65, N-terminal domain
MIEPGTFTVDPWSLTEPMLRLDLLGKTESIFALSNGHIGLRGNLDEGEPHATPRTYLNGFFEAVPLPYAVSCRLRRISAADLPDDVNAANGPARGHRGSIGRACICGSLEVGKPAGRADNQVVVLTPLQARFRALGSLGVAALHGRPSPAVLGGGAVRPWARSSSFVRRANTCSSSLDTFPHPRMPPDAEATANE